MTDYAKLVGIFNAFDKMATSVVENCRKFSETATDVGAGVGGIVGGLFGTIANPDGDAADADILAGLGGIIGGVIGTLVGKANKSIQYSSTKEELITKIARHRVSWSPIVSDAIADAEKQRTQLENEELPLLITLFQNNDIQQESFYYREVLHQYIRQAFQLSYIIEKGKLMLSYFDSCEEKLKNDLEGFPTWSQSAVTLSKTPIFEQAYFLVYNKIVEYEPARELLPLLAAECPIRLTDSSYTASQQLIDAALQAYADTISRKKLKKVTLPYSLEYYKSRGFKEVFFIIASYMDDLRIEKRKWWVPILFVWWPLVLTGICAATLNWGELIGLQNIKLLGQLVNEAKLYPVYTLLISFFGSELFGILIFNVWNKIFTARSVKIFKRKQKTDMTVASYMRYTENHIVEEEFDQKVNTELIQQMATIISTDTDDTAEIKERIDSFQSTMTDEELSEVEQELTDISYDF